MANSENSNDFANVKAIILDIEGTTTSISFVKDTLFPLVKKNLVAHLDKFWDSEELKDDIKLLKEQAEKDKTDEVEGFVPIEDGDNLKDSIVKNVLWQMDLDKKTTALKQLQGHIWRDAYKNGDIKGHVYPEVAETMKGWVDGGRRVFIYSSGSVEAQKLLFGHSESGDLLNLISGHFDTAVGPKTAQDSYVSIAKEIGHPVEELLFLTDVDKEAEAAHGAGFHSVLVVREGNAPLSDEIIQKFQTINSLGDLVFQSCAKRAKTSTEEETVEKTAETPASEEIKKDDEAKPAEEAPPATAMETEEVKEPIVEEKTSNEDTKTEESCKVEEVMETESTAETVVENGKEPEVTEPEPESKKEEPEKTEEKEEVNGTAIEELKSDDKPDKTEETQGTVEEPCEKTEEEVKTENGAEKETEKENGTTNGTTHINGKENGTIETNGKETTTTETNGKAEVVEPIEVKKLDEIATPPAVEVAAE